jgi:hypothetical protein
MIHLKPIIGVAEFDNSAGRLLLLLRQLNVNGNYGQLINNLYVIPGNSDHLKAKAFSHFVGLIGSAFEKFNDDLEGSKVLPIETKTVIKSKFEYLYQVIYPSAIGAGVQKPTEEHTTMIRLAASMMEKESKIETDDLKNINSSIDEIDYLIQSAEINSDIKNALREICKISKECVDYYSIYGGNGFRDAFKRMLGELMDVYLAQDVKSIDEKPEWWNVAYKHILLFDKVASKILEYQPLLSSANIFIGS